MAETSGTSGTLYLCATPIGNLGDITRRVLDTLRSVDVIAAEDTRNTVRLLNHFDIHTPLTSYHEFNKYDKAEELIRSLKAGRSIACVTDAGTPAISDPGEVLVRRCLEEGIHVTSLPGACALITALTLSGRSARRFCFEGFLPADRKERRHVLGQLETEERTIILYEAPHRLKETLKELMKTLGEDRGVTICRELTKIYEEAVPTTFGAAVSFYQEQDPRGEYVLVIDGADPEKLRQREADRWSGMSVPEHVAFYESQGMDHREAMKKTAADLGVSKRDIYNELLQQPRESEDRSGEA